MIVAATRGTGTRPPARGIEHALTQVWRRFQHVHSHRQRRRGLGTTRASCIESSSDSAPRRASNSARSSASARRPSRPAQVPRGHGGSSDCSSRRRIALGARAVRVSRFRAVRRTAPQLAVERRIIAAGFDELRLEHRNWSASSSGIDHPARAARGAQRVQGRPRAEVSWTGGRWVRILVGLGPVPDLRWDRPGGTRRREGGSRTADGGDGHLRTTAPAGVWMAHFGPHVGTR